ANDRSVTVRPMKLDPATVIFACVAVWLAIAVAVGVAASMRGRGGFGWFLICLLVSPLIVGPLVFALPRVTTKPEGSWAFSILKWLGITILFGCLAALLMFALPLFLIIQHGGA